MSVVIHFVCYFVDKYAMLCFHFLVTFLAQFFIFVYSGLNITIKMHSPVVRTTVHLS